MSDALHFADLQLAAKSDIRRGVDGHMGTFETGPLPRTSVDFDTISDISQCFLSLVSPVQPCFRLELDAKVHEILAQRRAPSGPDGRGVRFASASAATKGRGSILKGTSPFFTSAPILVPVKEPVEEVLRCRCFETWRKKQRFERTVAALTRLSPNQRDEP